MEFIHKPVLLNEVLSGLNISPDGLYLDCTVGGGGHSFEIASRLNKNGELFCIDKDDDALIASKDKLKKFDNITLIKSDFKLLDKEVLQNKKFDGILIDLGVSSYQIDTAERGFSFLKEGPLDMRMDKTSLISAFDVVNKYPKEKLLKILYEYGEEDNARIIVNAIIKNREISAINTTTQLVKIIEESLPAKLKFKGASQKTFQAIRIEVNQELTNLGKAIEFFVSILNKKGRLAIISFHSLEDRIVKNVFKDLSTNCICPPKTPICICKHKATIQLVNKKPIVANEEELKQNSRSKSAKLRVVEKL